MDAETALRVARVRALALQAMIDAGGAPRAEQCKRVLRPLAGHLADVLPAGPAEDGTVFTRPARPRRDSRKRVRGIWS